MLPPVGGREVSLPHRAADWVALVAVAVGEWECGFSDKFRPVGEYIGYTCDHLPACVRIPLPRIEDATPASFAARMAFSSFPMRSPVRYGRSAISSAR